MNLWIRPSAIEVKEGQVPADVIGDAYEYMIGQFVQAWRQEGQGLFILLRQFLRSWHASWTCSLGTAYDPTCGSGSLLISAAKKQNSKEVSIYGQEVNGSSVAMAKMNMYIHETRDAKIGWGDTLLIRCSGCKTLKSAAIRRHCCQYAVLKDKIRTGPTPAANPLERVKRVQDGGITGQIPSV